MSLGPCTVHIEATIDNNGPGGTGDGVINHLETITPGEGCETSATPLNNCRVADATNLAATGGGVVDISTVSFTAAANSKSPTTTNRSALN
jgi:hypothetical protein